MCGITGYAGINNEQLLHSMCDIMIHRGPDDSGYYTDHHIGLAMRRLSIIDLKTGHQPISNETGDVWVVFNGEIYNYESLRDEMLAKGHTFTTQSDTETIVHLYEEYGLNFVDHLRGMFGIALWDTKKRQLILVRDRIGEKPLYYSYENGKLLFGSEIKTILQGLDSRTVDKQSLCDFFAAGYVGGPRTMYREVSKLQPGHMLLWTEQGIDVKRYWKNDFTKKLVISYDDAFEKLEHELSQSVKLCLKSDVEVGAFLSGGVDSSLIVALMKEHEANVQTFSVGYGGKASGFNELSYARKVADHLGTKHHELILDAQSSLELLPKIMWHYDEPHGEPTSVLVYLLCEFVQKTVKVALSGTGGDELFYGYPKHVGVHYHKLYRKIPGFLRRQVIERLLGHLPESTTGGRFAKRAKRFLNGSELPPAEAYLSWVSLLSREVRENLFSESVNNGVNEVLGESFMTDRLTSSDSPDDLLDRVSMLDIEGYLPEYQLTYMDRMSMATSLEVRAPLCDYQLLEYATSLPHNYRLKGTTTKYILKDVAKKWLPDEIVDRKKVGFDSPIGQWFKDELSDFLDSFLSTENIEKSGLFDPDAVNSLISAHMKGERDYSLQLWSLLSVEVWYRMYIEDGITDGTEYKLSDLRGSIN